MNRLAAFFFGMLFLGSVIADVERKPVNQYAYEKNFVLKSFLGFEFGEEVGKYCVSDTRETGCYPVEYKIELKRPFRLFKTGRVGTANVGGGENNKVVSVRLWTMEDKNISRESYAAEVNAIAKMMEDKYRVRFDSNVHIPARYFKNEHVEISIRNDHYALSVAVKNLDVEREERLKAERARSFISLPANEGADML